MIIKQWLDVLEGRKTETRRLNEGIYQVGRSYAVVPARTKPAIWYRYWDATLQIWHEMSQVHKTPPQDRFIQEWSRLRILITAKWQESLQAITEAGALAEGITCKNGWYSYSQSIAPNPGVPNAVSAYLNLWNGINRRKWTRWEDNPLVWVYRFEVVRERLAYTSEE